jgi:hypothetical protein
MAESCQVKLANNNKACRVARTRGSGCVGGSLEINGCRLRCGARTGDGERACDHFYAGGRDWDRFYAGERGWDQYYAGVRGWHQFYAGGQRSIFILIFLLFFITVTFANVCKYTKMYKKIYKNFKYLHIAQI